MYAVVKRYDTLALLPRMNFLYAEIQLYVLTSMILLLLITSKIVRANTKTKFVAHLEQCVI